MDVYKRALEGVRKIIAITRKTPREERFELIAQIKASARSVCSCIAEAWRKRNYPAAFASKLTEAESEAAETQTWMDIALLEGYVTKELCDEMIAHYEVILAQLVRTRITASKWTHH